MLRILLVLFLCLQCTLVQAADKLSLNFQNLEIAKALKSLADISGTALILEDGLQGQLTMKLEAESFAEALDIICQAKGLNYRFVKSIAVVGPGNKGQASYLPLVSYRLNFRSAQELASELKELFQGKLLAEPLTNTLLLKGNSTEQKRLQELLTTLDRPSPQVSMEAKILAINEEVSKSLGIRWNWDNLPSTHGTDSETYGGHFKLWRKNNFSYNATLNALLTEGKAKIIAKPCLLTLPGKEATIFIGDHIPVQTEKRDSNGSYTSTEYVDAGIKLKYTPIISADNKYITAKVHTEVATASLVSEMTNYKITSRTADTYVRLADKETLVIGGLINEEEQKNLQKVPLLGDIPLIGALFRSHHKKKSKVEVIMLLTPHILLAPTQK